MSHNQITGLTANHNLHVDGTVRFEGGFTATEKFIVPPVDEQSPPNGYFIKTASAGQRADIAALRAEAAHYSTLTMLGLSGDEPGCYFPTFQDFVESGSGAALAIDYLPDVTWGEPWTAGNIDRLYDAFADVHATPLTDEQKQKTHDISQEMLAAQKGTHGFVDEAHRRSLYTFCWTDDKTALENGEGERYYEATPEIHDVIKQAAASFDPDLPEALMVGDVNFGNIGFSKDQVHFVDPVYLKIGNPAIDLSVAGVNILRLLPKTDTALRQQVMEKFLQDRGALANQIQYLAVVSSLRYEGEQRAWGAFHQECAITALDAWRDITGQ